MSGVVPLSRAALAARVARDIPDGAFVNLGIGMPDAVADHLPPGREVFVHSENGVLNVGPSPPRGREDRNLINAGKKPVTILPGGSYFDSALSFAMMRGGHLDVSVLGAFEVSASGDLANWSTGSDGVPAVGGAMDLAVGARAIWAMMEHTTRDGRPRIVGRCSLPLTARGVVRRIYTTLAVLDVTPEGLAVRELVPGLDLDGLQAVTAAPLLRPDATTPAPLAAAAE